MEFNTINVILITLMNVPIINSLQISWYCIIKASLNMNMLLALLNHNLDFKYEIIISNSYSNKNNLKDCKL